MAAAAASASVLAVSMTTAAMPELRSMAIRRAEGTSSRDQRGAAVLHDADHRANRFAAEVHDRMPVILRPEQFDAWLDRSMGVDDIKTPIDDDYLRRRRVARRVNSSRAPTDDPTLIAGAA